jgi:hypothetical protein
MVPSSQILSGAGACLATGVNQRPQGLPLGAVPFRSVGFGPAPSTPPPILALSLLFERSEITSRIAASALLQVVLLAAERATQRYWMVGSCRAVAASVSMPVGTFRPIDGQLNINSPMVPPPPRGLSIQATWLRESRRSVCSAKGSSWVQLLASARSFQLHDRLK